MVWYFVLFVSQIVSVFLIFWALWVYLPNIVTNYLNRNFSRTFTFVSRKLLAFIHCKFQIIVLRNFSLNFLELSIYSLWYFIFYAWIAYFIQTQSFTICYSSLQVLLNLSYSNSCCLFPFCFTQKVWQCFVLKSDSVILLNANICNLGLIS